MKEIKYNYAEDYGDSKGKSTRIAIARFCILCYGSAPPPDCSLCKRFTVVPGYGLLTAFRTAQCSLEELHAFSQLLAMSTVLQLIPHHKYYHFLCVI